MSAIRHEDGSIPAAMLLGSAVTADAAASASPLTYATDAMPPTLLYQGTEDILIGTGGAVTFYEALRAAAMPCELHLVAGVNHEFDVTPTHDRRLLNDQGELLASSRRRSRGILCVGR